MQTRARRGSQHAARRRAAWCSCPRRSGRSAPASRPPRRAGHVVQHRRRRSRPSTPSSASRVLTDDTRAARDAAATERTGRRPAQSGCPRGSPSAAAASAPGDRPVPETRRRPAPPPGSSRPWRGPITNRVTCGANRPTKPISPPSATAAPVRTEPSRMTRRLSLSTETPSCWADSSPRLSASRLWRNSQPPPIASADHDDGQHELAPLGDGDAAEQPAIHPRQIQTAVDRSR